MSSSSQDPIVSLSALLERKVKVTRLILDRLPELTSLNGLDSIYVEGYLKIDDLPNLVDVSGVTHNTHLRELSFTFNEYITDLYNFKHFNDLNLLITVGEGKIEGIYVNDYKIRIWIKKNKNFDLEWVIANNGFERITLQLSDSKEFDLKNLKSVDLSSLYIRDCTSFNLNGLQSNSEIVALIIEDSNIDSLSEYSFNGLKSVSQLVIDNVASLGDLSEILPNIQEIEQTIKLSNNSNLVNIDGLDQVPLPIRNDAYVNYTDDHEVYVSNNSLLDPCTSEFICRANEIYPQKIFLQDNATDCYQSGFCTDSGLFHQTDASWTYGVQDQLDEAIDYVTYDMQDTIHLDRKIGVHLETGDSEERFIGAREGDRFYFWDDELNSFQLHYDFAATDHYDTRFYNSFTGVTENIIIYVDSIEQRMIDGQPVRVQHLRSDFGRTGLPDIKFEVADQIGSMQYGLRLPIHAGLQNTDDIIGTLRQNEDQLRCYSDKKRSIRFVDFPCDSTWSYSTSLLDFRPGEVSVYPNPTNDIIHIAGAQGFDLEVFDSYGRKVLELYDLSHGEVIESNQWSSGVYFFKFEKDGKCHSEKVIKTN